MFASRLLFRRSIIRSTSVCLSRAKSGSSGASRGHFAKRAPLAASAHTKSSVHEKSSHAAAAAAAKANSASNAAATEVLDERERAPKAGNLAAVSARTASQAEAQRVEADAAKRANLTPEIPSSPIISVIGVGGAGTNTINNMIAQQFQGVEFIVANTDGQSLSHSLALKRVQLGRQLTHGLGAGARPDVGAAAAMESLDEVMAEIEGSHMVFITAGCGGGTGSGAAPVIAKAAREKGILTVGIVTKPFLFEGAKRMRLADEAIRQMEEHVDTLIVIPNQKLLAFGTEHIGFSDAFKLVDNVLLEGVKGVTDLIVMPGLINLDFADVKTIMSNMGRALMGSGEAEGRGRAAVAAEMAIHNPLLEDVSIDGATGVLISITGGSDLNLREVDEIANTISQSVDPDANIIFGATYDESLHGRVRVSVIVTGMPDSAKGGARAHVDDAVDEEPEQKKRGWW